MVNGIAKAWFSCCEIGGGDEREFGVKHLLLPGRCWCDVMFGEASLKIIIKRLMLYPKSLGFFGKQYNLLVGLAVGFITLHPFRWAGKQAKHG